MAEMPRCKNPTCRDGSTVQTGQTDRHYTVVCRQCGSTQVFTRSAAREHEAEQARIRREREEFGRREQHERRRKYF